MNVRLRTAIHSRADRRQGLLGARPISIEDSVKPSAFAALAGEEAHRRADAAGEEEARTERAHRDDGQVRTQLRRDVRRLAEPLPQLLDGDGELVALALDLAPQRLGRPRPFRLVVVVAIAFSASVVSFASLDRLLGNGRRAPA